MQDIDGRDVELKKYAGKVLLIVNVASQVQHSLCRCSRRLLQSKALYSGLQ